MKIGPLITKGGIKIFVVVLLALAIPMVAAFAVFRADIRAESRERVANDLGPHAEALRAEVNERLGQLQALTAFVETHQDVEKLDREFDTFARGLAAKEPGVRALEVAPNGVITYIFPKEGNEEALGADLLHDKRIAVREDVARGIATKRTIVGGPYELLQGGQGVVARQPLYDGAGAFYAFTQVVFNIDQIVQDSGLAGPSEPFEATLRTGRGQILHGRAGIVSDKPVIYKIRVADEYWEMAAIPKGGWRADTAGPEAAGLGGGATIIVLLAIVITGAVDRGRYLRAAVAEQTSALVVANRALQESYKQLNKSLEDAVRAIAALGEHKDPYTVGHEQRVVALAVAIGAEMGLTAEALRGLKIAATLHDVGKMYVPAEILSKPGKLSDIEMALIKVHPTYSYEVLSKISFPWPVADIAVQHHERMDGSGYPQGLKGDAILLEARILAVADVIEAMASHRPYRPAHKIETALREIADNRGKLYDPAVVDAAITIFKKGFKIPDH